VLREVLDLLVLLDLRVLKVLRDSREGQGLKEK
jgi:hypothetical protein